MLIAALGVGIVGIILLVTCLLRLNGAHEMLGVLAVWCLCSSGARLLVEWYGLSRDEALTFTGALSYGVIPVLLWILWKEREWT